MSFFQVFFKHPTSTVTAEVTSSDTIRSLKEKIFEKEGFPVEKTRLVFAGKQLEDDQTIGDYNIQSESTITLIGRRPHNGTPFVDELVPSTELSPANGKNFICSLKAE
jgi:large subunit ribosomal protein L40e